MSILKFERLQAMPKLKQEIISYLFNHVSRKDHNRWHKYIGEFKYEGKEYNLECEVKWDNQMFTFRNMFIEHKQEVLDIEDMIKAGMMDA